MIRAKRTKLEIYYEFSHIIISLEKKVDEKKLFKILTEFSLSNFFVKFEPKEPIIFGFLVK